MSPVPPIQPQGNSQADIRLNFRPFSLEEQKRIKELYLLSRQEDITIVRKNNGCDEPLTTNSSQRASRIPGWLLKILAPFIFLFSSSSSTEINQ